MNKIVFIAPSIKTGGGNRVFIELANILCEEYDISVLFPNNSEEYHMFQKSSNLQYTAIGKKALSKMAKWLNLCRCIRYVNRHLGNADLVISDPIFCLLIPFIKNKKRIYRFIQADDYRIFDDGAILGKGLLLGLYKTLCLRVYRQHVGYLFNSQYVYDRFCQDSKRTDVPLMKVYPAVNHLIFNPKNKDKGHGGISICLVARKHPLKGLQTFIDAYHKLPLEIEDRIASVTLISHDDLSGYDTAGMRIVKPASDYDIATAYSSSDIFISTSWWEGFGLPPLEAMACGCAVICSNSGGVNEFVVTGENCLTFEPKDEDALIKAIMRLANDEALRKSLALHGVETAEKFRWEESAKQMLSVINQSI